jgi:hypothetical protein
MISVSYKPSYLSKYRSALGHTDPPIQWLPKALSWGIRRPESETSRIGTHGAVARF